MWKNGVPMTSCCTEGDLWSLCLAAGGDVPRVPDPAASFWTSAQSVPVILGLNSSK